MTSRGVDAGGLTSSMLFSAGSSGPLAGEAAPRRFLAGGVSDDVGEVVLLREPFC